MKNKTIKLIFKTANNDLFYGAITLIITLGIGMNIASNEYAIAFWKAMTIIWMWISRMEGHVRRQYNELADLQLQGLKEMNKTLDDILIKARVKHKRETIDA